MILRGKLVIFLALAFVKVPWMMTGDCGWATIFFFFFFLRNKLTVSLGIGKKKKKKHQVTGMRPTNSVKNIE